MMKTVIRHTALLLIATAAQAISASSLTVVTRHDVVVSEDATKQLMRVAFADEALAADVELNVYALELRPSTRANYEELRTLKEESWVSELTWSLVTAEGRSVTLPYPEVLSNRVRQRGPDAARPADRDTTVPMTTYRARVSFGAVGTGDYVLEASVRGLTSKFHFVVRTGREPGLRDHYLRLKARRTRNYVEYRRLQLERLEYNALRADALYELIDRALEHGTLEETVSYFDRAIAISAERRRTVTDAVGLERMEAGSARLRAIRGALPEYFANRGSRTMTRDPKSGHYAMRDRTSGAIIREFGATTPR